MTDALANRDGTVENIDSDVVITANEILNQHDILKRFAKDVELAGLVGEKRVVKLLYLALTSRLVHPIVSIKVEGAA